MGHLFFYLAVVAAALLWSATFVAAAARTGRPWLHRLLVAAAVIVPPLALVPWVGLTALLAFGANIRANWFAPTLTALVSAVVGGLWILRAGLAREDARGGRVAARWPVIGLAAMVAMAQAVAFGTLLFIDNAVAAQGRMLRVEASQLMLAHLPPQPLPDDDAAPLYLRVLPALEADRTFFDGAGPAAQPLTTDIAAPEVAAGLARHAATLDLLRRAADRPGCRFVRDWSRPSLDLLLPEVQHMRRAAKLLVLAARRESADGDAAAAVRDVVRLRRVAEHAAAEPILICGLVGQAIDALALETLADVLPRLQQADRAVLDDTALRDFVETPIAFDRHFLGEEAFGLATLADLADGRSGASAGRLFESVEGAAVPSEVLVAEPVSLLFRSFLLPADVAGYRRIMGLYERCVTGNQPPRPFPAMREQCSEIEQELRGRSPGILTRMLVPALDSCLRAEAAGRARHRAAEVLVAATRARLETGAVPATLDELVSDRFPAVPRDPFTTDRPLLAKRSEGNLVVYSVGPDGEDDGGPAPAGAGQQGNDDVGVRLAL